MNTYQTLCVIITKNKYVFSSTCNDVQCFSVQLHRGREAQDLCSPAGLKKTVASSAVAICQPRDIDTAASLTEIDIQT